MNILNIWKQQNITHLYTPNTDKFTETEKGSDHRRLGKRSRQMLLNDDGISVVASVLEMVWLLDWEYSLGLMFLNTWSPDDALLGKARQPCWGKHLTGGRVMRLFSHDPRPVHSRLYAYHWRCALWAARSGCRLPCLPDSMDSPFGTISWK